MRRFPRSCFSSSPCCLRAAPARADADAQAQAKQRFARGAQAYREARYQDAIDLFREANRLDPHPDLVFNTGQAYEKLGDVGNALRSYREYLRLAPAASDRATVEASIKNLEARLRARGVQQVSIFSTPAGASLVLDERGVGQTPWTGEIAPGRHVAVLRASGYPDTAKAFVLVPEHAMDLDIALILAAPVAPAGRTPEEAPPPSPLPTPAAPLAPPRGAVDDRRARRRRRRARRLARLRARAPERGERRRKRPGADPLRAGPRHHDQPPDDGPRPRRRGRSGDGPRAACSSCSICAAPGAPPAKAGLGCFTGACGPVLSDSSDEGLHALLAATGALVSSWAAAGAGCSSDLTETSPGHDRCDATGQCVAGYVCEAVTNTCVLAGTLAGGTGGTPSTTGTGGKGGSPAGTGGVGTWAAPAPEALARAASAPARAVSAPARAEPAPAAAARAPGSARADRAGDAGCTSPHTVSRERLRRPEHRRRPLRLLRQVVR